MPPANNLAAHTTYLDVLQQALESERGLRVRTPNPVDYRGRLYHARAADRRQNAKVYPETEVMHGKSAYDCLIVRLEPEAVRIEKYIEANGIEEL